MIGQGKMPKKKEEPLFVEPEFNEVDYIRDQKETAKAVVTIFIIGALIGLLSGYLSIIGLWYFSILIIFVFLLFLRIILNSLGMTLPKRTSQKFFLVGEFILTWLVFWILFLNPPLHVVSGPQISDLQVQSSSGWVNANEPKLDVFNVPVSDHSLRLYVNYKYSIDSISVNQALKSSPSSTTPLTSHYSGNYVYFNVTGNINLGTVLLVTVNAHSTQASSTYTFTLNFVQTTSTSAAFAAATPHIFRAGVV